MSKCGLLSAWVGGMGLTGSFPRTIYLCVGRSHPDLPGASSHLSHILAFTPRFPHQFLDPGMYMFQDNGLPECMIVVLVKKRGGWPVAQAEPPYSPPPHMSLPGTASSSTSCQTSVPIGQQSQVWTGSEKPGPSLLCDFGTVPEMTYVDKNELVLQPGLCCQAKKIGLPSQG